MTETKLTQGKQDLMQTSESDIQNYVGKSWNDYALYWKLIRTNEVSSFWENLKRTNWLAVFLPPVWFLYRKLYLEMIAFFALAYTVIYIADSQKIHIPVVVYGVVVAVVSRPYYLTRGVKLIKKIRAEGLDEATTQARIAAVGGVSLVSAGIGMVFILLALVVTFMEAKKAMDTANTTPAIVSTPVEAPASK